MTPSRKRAVGHALVVAGLAIGAYDFLVLAPHIQLFGFDAYAYWAVDLAAPYEIPHGARGSFPYPPPAAIVAATFSLVPWGVFIWLWTALLLASIFWIGGTVGWVLVILALPFVSLELHQANIHILIAVAVLLGFRHPWTWAFVLLTKVTCGVALLWFAARGEWRSLAIALGATAAIGVVTLALVPEMWFDWLEYAIATAVGHKAVLEVDVPLAVRLPAAALLVIWGARTDRRWTVFASVAMTLPVVWINGLAVLIGIIGEVEHRRGTLASRALSRFRVA